MVSDMFDDMMLVMGNAFSNRMECTALIPELILGAILQVAVTELHYQVVLGAGVYEIEELHKS
eukprot:6080730-Amphidinium_carterae.1